MKKFFFRLETLLKVRKVKEARLARELAIAERKLAQWVEKEETLHGQIDALMEEIQHKRAVGEHMMQDTYSQILDHLNTSLEQVVETREGQEKQVEEHRARLKQGVQERKLIEKIKEKHYTQWRSQSDQTEDSLSDEAALNSRRGR